MVEVQRTKVLLKETTGKYKSIEITAQLSFSLPQSRWIVSLMFWDRLEEAVVDIICLVVSVLLSTRIRRVRYD
jgi:hypothetical protein